MQLPKAETYLTQIKSLPKLSPQQAGFGNPLLLGDFQDSTAFQSATKQ
jgi:hypothetical protein